MNVRDQVSAIVYTSGYYRLLSPAHLRLLCHERRVPFPAGEPLRYLELGHGNGVSLNIHAAATPGEYWGVDINPAHVGNSQTLSQAAGLDVRNLNLSFEDLLRRADLPTFDIVVMHGVWSWISDASRRAVVALLGERLASGGLFCVSYNCAPGSSAIAPLKRLLHLHCERNGADGAIMEKWESSVLFAERIRQAGGGYFEANPQAARRLEEIKHKSPSYLLHEYLSEFWHTPAFADVAAELRDAGLDFVSSAYCADACPELALAPDAVELIGSLADPWLRETTGDFLRNRQFRHDLFVKKGAGGPGERAGEDAAFMLLAPRGELPSLLNGRRMDEAPFPAIFALLAAEDHAPKTLEILARGAPEAARADIRRALMLLVDVGLVQPAQPATAAHAARPTCERFNEHALREARASRPLRALASPATGAGVPMSPLQQLCLIAYRSGARTIAELVSAVAAEPAARHGQDGAHGNAQD
jgi:SAM-dependent methyltransferase